MVIPTRQEKLAEYAREVRYFDLAWERDYASFQPPPSALADRILELVDVEYPRDRIESFIHGSVLQMQALLQDVLSDVSDHLPSNARRYADCTTIGFIATQLC